MSFSERWKTRRAIDHWRRLSDQLGSGYNCAQLLSDRSMMAAPVTPVTASRDLSLPEINTLVAQQESILGPLLTIGNDGSENLLFFDFDRDPPEKHAVIETAEPPPNSTILTTAKIFIGGQLEDVSVYRPN